MTEDCIRDYLVDMRNTKRKHIKLYEKLSDAIDEFQEKYEKQGINFTTNIDWRTKQELYISLFDVPEDYSFMDPIIEEFKREFHVDLTEKLIEHSYIVNQTRVKWVFRSNSRWK